jgi:hypothetical protein
MMQLFVIIIKVAGLKYISEKNKKKIVTLDASSNNS